MLKLVEFNVQDRKKTLSGIIENGGVISNKDVQIMQQLKGQIAALTEVLSIKDYLLEISEERQDEIQSSGSEDLTKSEED